MKKIGLPYAGKIKCMGVPKGITLITGGGYHGKSTLLNALEAGIYNHIPWDDRELCVSNAHTVKIRACRKVRGKNRYIPFHFKSSPRF